MDDAELIVLVPTQKSFSEETILPTVPPASQQDVALWGQGATSLHLAYVGLTVYDFADQHHVGDTDK